VGTRCSWTSMVETSLRQNREQIGHNKSNQIDSVISVVKKRFCCVDIYSSIEYVT
jgi:hypothetical protein